MTGKLRFDLSSTSGSESEESSRSTSPVKSALSLESIRLERQFNFVNEHVRKGYLTWDVVLPHNARVLETGTGNGAWLLTLAKQLPKSAILYAIDEYNTFFPTKHPPNVHFYQAPSTYLPLEWTCQFDLVSQSYQATRLKKKNWWDCLRFTFKRILKPSGTRSIP
ncbi:hypothetical protein VNI00_018854 [Paramarasmius palmivorus]|uniref:Methyltransferase domain-containing protein n=1 Tax=Paramarasmius palmivorus TaxID=297713 RepID=A0AAW0AUJ8_9AGAR